MFVLDKLENFFFKSQTDMNRSDLQHLSPHAEGQSV